MGSSIHSVKSKVEDNVYCALYFYKRKGNVYMFQQKKEERKETERINQNAEEEGNVKKNLVDLSIISS